MPTRQDPFSYLFTCISHFFMGFANLCRFLPHFFSIAFILRTFFSPWKRTYVIKTTPGFSLEEWMRTTSFNIISSVIGALLRTLLLLTYLIIQIFVFVLFFPVFFLYLAGVAFLYPFVLIQPTEEQRKQQAKTAFVKMRLLNQENTQAVEQWFEQYFRTYQQKQAWWTLPGLFTIPPLARDWHMGFTVMLDRYGNDLTQLIKSKRPIIGRKKEIEQIEHILSKSGESNVVIVGEEGVGKQTIVEELAKRMYYGQTTKRLVYKRVVSVSMEQILSEHIDQHQKETLVQTIFSEAAAAGNIILVIRDLDRYVSGEGGRVDLSGIIEPLAKTNALQCIGITTPFLYQKYVYANEKIRQIFQKVAVQATTPDEALRILMDVSLTFEKTFSLIIPFETLKTIIEKSEYYITAIPFPEKAIELLDEVCASALQSKRTTTPLIVTPDMVDQVLSRKTNIPTVLSEDIRRKLTNLESILSGYIIDQENAIQKIASTLRRSFLLIGKRKKPFATLLFLGPTGVGKTQTAKAIATFFFGSDTYLYRFDMASYQSKQDIPTLIGSSDKNQPGLLTQSIRNNPYGVLLLDEFEKANKDLLNIFLPIIDEGYFTDGFGKPVDCKNLIIIATSNAGSDVIYQELDRDTKVKGDGWLVNHLVSHHIFSPELLNRFDQVILYQPLEPASIFKIATKEIDVIKHTLYKLHHVHLVVTDAFLSDLIKREYDRKFGARNMQRIIRDTIEDTVAKMILEKKVKDGDTITL